MLMKNSQKIVMNVLATTVFCVLGFLITMVFIIANDAIEFHDIMGSKYKTPWYNANPWKQPYTALRIKLIDEKDKKEYWTQNSMKSENWLVRETKIGDIVFWTTVERIEI